MYLKYAILVCKVLDSDCWESSNEEGMLKNKYKLILVSYQEPILRIYKILCKWLHRVLQILLQNRVQVYLGDKILWKFYPITRSGFQNMRDLNFARIAGLKRKNTKWIILGNILPFLSSFLKLVLFHSL